MLFVSGSIPDNIAPYLALGLFLIPIGLFIPVSTFAYYRHWMRKTRRRFDSIRSKLANCGICGDPLPTAARLRDFRRVQGFHYAAAHPEVWKWDQRWRKITIPILAIGILAVPVFVYELFAKNYLQSLIAFACLPLVLLIFWFQRHQFNHFRALWNEQTIRRE